MSNPHPPQLRCLPNGIQAPQAGGERNLSRRCQTVCADALPWCGRSQPPSLCRQFMLSSHMCSPQPMVPDGVIRQAPSHPRKSRSAPTVGTGVDCWPLLCSCRACCELQRLAFDVEIPAQMMPANGPSCTRSAATRPEKIQSSSFVSCIRALVFLLSCIVSEIQPM